MELWQSQLIPGKILLDLQHNSSEGYLGSLDFWLNNRGAALKSEPGL